MAGPNANIRLCDNGKGWCVEVPHESYGPMESETEARHYAQLMNRVSAARTQIACTDEVCWQ